MPKRSYGQYCGLARALDVVGARWSLLIVRELLTGPARYSELLNGLPGIATNLLADRLRELEDVGVVERALDTESNGITYMLTPWGSELRDAVAALVNWSTPLMLTGPQDDTFQAHWLVVAIDSLLRGRRANDATTVGLSVDDVTVAVHVGRAGTQVTLVDGDDQPGTVLRGGPDVVLGLASGMLTVEEAVAAGDLLGHEADLAVVFGPR